MRFDEPIGVVKARESFPMLEHFIEPEASRTQHGGNCAIEGSGEGQHDRLFAFIALTCLACEGAPAKGSPVLDLLLVAGAIAQ